MSLDFSSLNYFAIIVAAVVRMAIGMTYYSPAVLGKTWMKISGMDEKEMGNKWVTLGYYFLVVLLIALVFSALIQALGITDIWTGACLGFWIWLGFVATATVQGVIFSGKSCAMFLLTTGEELISYVVMGGILAMMA